jgi:hypothetical protein
MSLVDSVANEMETTPEDLTSDQRAWVEHSAQLWDRAHAIVNGRPDLDVSDVYHALRTLELPPAERLRRGLTRVRFRPHAR